MLDATLNRILTLSVAVVCAVPGYQGYYQAALMIQACTQPPSLLLGANAPLCDPPWLPLNGSAFLQYNSTSYNDDMAWASTWMYLCVLTFLITNLFLGL